MFSRVCSYRDPDTGFVVAQYIWFARHGCSVHPWGSGATPWGARANSTTEHDPKYDEILDSVER